MRADSHRRVVVGGRYQLESEIAKGGMGTVYRATDLRNGQVIALKRLRSEDPSRVIALFEREYRTLAGIQHPRIVEAYDYGVDAGGPYYTMELVEGVDLHELAPVPARDACRHMRDVASCLALLHTRRLLHRDITPKNVRVLPDGTCKLLDFGALASFGVAERVVGTPPFVPPEALQDVALDQRADVFSLGALLYWTMTRKHAFSAKRIDALPEVWRERPISPRTLVPEIPPEVEALVLRMLSVNPMARPASMVEVVERLSAAADLEPEPEVTRRALADSYLAQADLVGRDTELETFRRRLGRLSQGRGSATLVYGSSGVGRTRLLEEVVVQAELLGVHTLQLDGDECRRDDQAALTVIRHMLITSAGARQEAKAFADVLAWIGPDVAAYAGIAMGRVKPALGGRGRLLECAVALVRAACEGTPMLLTVDNLDEVDESSLATIASFTRLTTQVPLCLALGMRSDQSPRTSILWALLTEHCQSMTLGALSAEQTLALSRSMFGEAPNLLRFAHWMHELSGGLPLHMVELVRQLQMRGEIRFAGGQWHLPNERPEQVQLDSFAELITGRLERLSAPARALAEALAVQRTSLTRTLAFELAEIEGDARALLDELVRYEVLVATLFGFRFAHARLRDALIETTDGERRKVLHRRCAERVLADLRGDRRRAYIEAGWHLLEAGDERQGAERIAAAAVDTVAIRHALADVPEYASAIETALRVYIAQGRSLYERLPLISTLAQAGYYGDREWGLRYGDMALAALQEASGLNLARQWQPKLGRNLSVVLGLATAFVRFTFLRKRGPHYSFREVLVQLLGVVTTLTGAASIALDVERADKIASTLDPFLGLWERLTPVGIAQFCQALKEIGRDNSAQAVAVWQRLLARFRNPLYYPSLPADARDLYVGGLLFSLGAFTNFRDGDDGLRYADQLDKLDIKLYRMIASAIRAQHYAHRGNLQEAKRWRRVVDDHAVQVGSAWQAELWEPTSLILVHTTMGDVTEMRRVADRLRALAKEVPAQQRYAEFAELAFILVREEGFVPDGSEMERFNELSVFANQAVATFHRAQPRSFIGWGAIAGYAARALNLFGRHADAKALCEQALSHLTEADRDYVALFLNIELELAVAVAGLGDLGDSARRLGALMERHKNSDNPLTQGRIHEGYVRVFADTEQWERFREHLQHMRAWYSRTGSSSLIGRVELLAALDPKTPGGGRQAIKTLRLTQDSLRKAGVIVPKDEEQPATRAQKPSTES